MLDCRGACIDAPWCITGDEAMKVGEEGRAPVRLLLRSESERVQRSGFGRVLTLRKSPNETRMGELKRIPLPTPPASRSSRPSSSPRRIHLHMHTAFSNPFVLTSRLVS